VTARNSVPATDDVRKASELARRIVAAGRGRVRRVVMIGSRARGTPAKTSDLDLVVIVE
jgi:predicted nucleotidyltransferase